MSLELACVILDWKRPDNMPKVLEGVRRQSTECAIYVVHQENDRKYDVYENINLSINHACGARWSILSLIHLPYTVMVDDDLELTNPETFAVMLEAVKKYHHVSAIGVNLGTAEEPYLTGEKVVGTSEVQKVDICLGSLSMVRTTETAIIWNEGLPLVYQYQNRPAPYIKCDDILYAYLHRRAGGGEYVVGHGERPYEVLDTAHGLEHDPDHYTDRNDICKALGIKQMPNGEKLESQNA